MGGDCFVVDAILHVPARLINAKKSQAVEDARMDLLASICNDAHDYL